MYLSPDLRFWTWLLFQDVADCQHAAAASSLSSGPSGPSITGQPVGPVEGHTQERIQRPGECLQGLVFWVSPSAHSETKFILFIRCILNVATSVVKSHVLFTDHTAQLNSRRICTNRSPLPRKFTALVLISSYFTARFCFNRVINLPFNSFVISRTELCVNKLLLQVLKMQKDFFVGVH